VVIVLTGGSEADAIGRALAAALGWPLVEGGRAAELHAVAARAVDRREHIVIACPALSRRDRDLLRGSLRTVRFACLENGDDQDGHAREQRSADEALSLDAGWPPDRILSAIRAEFGL
jgi:hypothetical protein